MTDDRRIVVFIAASADGYIARPDGDVSWLDRGGSPENYGTLEFMEGIDTILWGRRTFEKAIELGGAFDEKTRHYVFTRDPPEEPPPGVEFVDEPVAEFCERLREEPGKDIWIMGGGELIASFLDAGQIDELIVYVMPVLIGEGVPLIARRRGDIPLELLSARSYENGVVRLHYAIGTPAEDAGLSGA